MTYTVPSGSQVAFDLRGAYTAPAGGRVAFNLVAEAVPSLVLSDLSKTFKTSFAIANATLAASGLTAPRTFTLPDQAGTVRLTLSSDDSVWAKLYASSNLR